MAGVDGTATALSVAGRDLRAPRAAGIAGLLFAGLFVASLLMLRGQPGVGSNADEIQRWYLGPDANRIGLIGLYLVPFSGIAFLWFIAVIRSHIGDREDQFFATVFLGSGLLFVAMLFAAAATASAPLASVKFQQAPIPGAGEIGLARALAYTLLYVYAVRVAGVFVITVSTIGLRTGSMPRWLAFSGYLIALAMLLSVSFYKFVVLLFPLWVAAVSITILLSPGRGSAKAEQPTAT